MERNLQCVRCGKKMGFAFTEHIQLGKTSLLFGDWPNLIAGAMLVDVYCCKGCGKMEFFAAEERETELPQVTCPKCGRQHDFDYPSCPFCKHEYGRSS